MSWTLTRASLFVATIVGVTACSTTPLAATPPTPISAMAPLPVAADARPIFDLIGRSEGTDKARGYNETLGYGAYTDGPIDLTRMTLNEIDDLQTGMLNHPKNWLHSSAVGRYQIVRTTLRRLRAQLDLNGTEYFNAQMQDLLAHHLLVGRGYNSWKNGQLSNNQFMSNLAKEWASLTDPTTGKGVYAGQQGKVTVQQQDAALTAEYYWR